MASDHISLDIVESSTPDGPSEIMEISEHGSAVSSPTSELVHKRPSKEIKTSEELESILQEEERLSIPKVPLRRREVHPTDYQPNFISIGPYHYGKDQFRAMDDLKRSSFANIVKLTGLGFKEFATIMYPLKERALKCYERPIHSKLESSAESFIEMMIYDGCFVLQLIRDMYPPMVIRVSKDKWTDMLYDLLLPENQLPFFVLLGLDDMITQKLGGDLDEFERAALSCFSKLDANTLKIFPRSETCPSPPDDIKHLLDMVHKCCRPSPQGITQDNKEPTSCYRFLLCGTKQLTESSKANESKRPVDSRKSMHSASELNIAGINFVGHKGKSLFDVTFIKSSFLRLHTKVLKIPTLNVCNNTERRLRNLVAYEESTRNGEPKYISDYVFLMHNLINTGKDVEFLCTSGVISNCLGDDEAVAKMFNELGDHPTYCREDFYYTEIFDKVDEHCKRNTCLKRLNKYLKSLKKDYFSSPWSCLSLLAAFILLLATLFQTVYTVLTFYHK